MSTEVIYARVPTALKGAADEYASQRGKTLTGAVVDLLGRGLSAATDERSVRDLEVEADLRAAETQLAALASFAERARRSMGSCPSCSAPVTGFDLLTAGQCSQCGQSLSELVVPLRAGPALDQREVLMLMGALGAVLAIAYLASK